MQQLKFHFSKIPHINKFLFDFSQHVILCTKYHGEKQVYTRQNQRKKYGGHCCVFALRIVINSRFLLELLEGSILISTIIGTIEDTGDQAFICCLYEKYEHLMFWATGKYLKNIEDTVTKGTKLLKRGIVIRKLSFEFGGTSLPHLCLWRRNSCAAGGVLL